VQTQNLARSFAYSKFDFGITGNSDMIAFVVCVFDYDSVLLAAEELGDLLQKLHVVCAVSREAADFALERCLAVNSTGLNRLSRLN
jgi:hypothetical protein